LSRGLALSGIMYDVAAGVPWRLKPGVGVAENADGAVLPATSDEKIIAASQKSGKRVAWRQQAWAWRSAKTGMWRRHGVTAYRYG